MPRFKRTTKDWVKDYLLFSKWQRRAILVILVGIFACIAWQMSLLHQDGLNSKRASALVLREASELVAWQPQDSLAGQFASNENWREPAGKPEAPASRYFPFDPNTATAEQWQKLGVRQKTIVSILKYRSKGGRFRKPEDLLRIYNLPKEQAEKLIPYVVIAATEANKATHFRRDSFAARPATVRGPSQIEINEADTSLWIALPGIGSRLANRIVSFREKLGGFYSISQVAETYALPDSTFQKIRHRLLLKSGPSRLININVASADELKSHPYIKWNLANAIVNYRSQHGAYQSLQDLQKIAIVEPAWLEKVLPYFTLR